MALPTFRVDLPISANPLWKRPYRHVQSLAPSDSKSYHAGSHSTQEIAPCVHLQLGPPHPSVSWHFEADSHTVGLGFPATLEKSYSRVNTWSVWKAGDAGLIAFSEYSTVPVLLSTPLLSHPDVWEKPSIQNLFFCPQPFARLLMPSLGKAKNLLIVCPFQSIALGICRHCESPLQRVFMEGNLSPTQKSRRVLWLPSPPRSTGKKIILPRKMVTSGN